MRPDPGLDEAALLEAVQRAGFAYFWDHAHPDCHLARDRSTRDVVSIGGSGMGLMCLIVACRRGWIKRQKIVGQLLVMLRFLGDAERHHGVWGHFVNGGTGRIETFSPLDDGADLVETAFLAAGLLCLRQFFCGDGAEDRQIRALADGLWRGIDWTAHLQPGEQPLFWHWSPRHGFAMNHRIEGWNECLIVYVMACASPTHRIAPEHYSKGWTGGNAFRNGKTYFGHDLPLGPAGGGPLFFAHFSFLGLDPRGLADAYADYWHQNRNQCLINRAYCIANPRHFAGYGAECWGLTASDSVTGYAAHAPDLDLGVIAPTAALASMPYTPEYSQQVLRHLLSSLPGLWGDWGFRDAFSPQAGWMAEATLAIDQGPIVIMIENYRSALMWNLLMSAPEIRTGIARLQFTSPWLSQFSGIPAAVS